MRTQQDRTIKGYNLDIVDVDSCTEEGWPRIEPTLTVPHELRSFEIADSKRRGGGFAHFFIDDYRMFRLWNEPKRYIDALRRYDGALSPDFSTYTDMPKPMQIWNKYRSMALARFWQQKGIEVIPTLQWSDERSLEWCFDGLPKGGVYAASTVGCVRNSRARGLFVEGIQEAIRVLEPKALVMYGVSVAFDARGVQLHRFSNDNAKRLRQWEEKMLESGAMKVVPESR